MKLEPLFDRVVMKALPPKQEKIGGIIMPEDEQKQVIEGTIIAVGEGTKDEPMLLGKGDMIIIQKFSGIRVTEDGTEYIIVKQKDVLCRKKLD
jgi:chaperonin GroES